MFMRSRALRRPVPIRHHARGLLDGLARAVLPGGGPRGVPLPDAPLRVLMPRGLTGLARESGIGAAMRHQESAVRSLGHQVVTSPLRPFDVVHLNTPFPDTPLLARCSVARCTLSGLAWGAEGSARRARLRSA